MEGLHAQIRDFAKDRYVETARARGASEFTLRAGDVHEARLGPKQGSNVFFTYRFQ